MHNELNDFRVLIVEDNLVHRLDIMRQALSRLTDSLRDHRIAAVRVNSYSDAETLAANDMDLDGFLIASDINSERSGESRTLRLLKLIARHQRQAPVFLLGDRERSAAALTAELMRFSSELVWIFEDSSDFIAGRISAAVARYRSKLLPPLMQAIWSYNEKQHEYSWAAPGHQGGIGFTKAAVGKKFFDFYGENLFRTDTGIERSSIGSLLDHSGAFADSEKLAAKTFGADVSYSVLVGTSGSNRTVMQSSLAPGSVAVCDRNCHKSIEQGLILSGATPVYMLPSRNCYGIIGPVRRSEMTFDAIANKIHTAGRNFDVSKGAVYAVLTNCTYDGICYNAVKAEKELSKSVDIVHFDEAWYAYAKFNKLYSDHYAMRGDPEAHSGATVIATHSTHKLLTALSQASYIHIRQGRNVLDFNRFNQAYMMHSTTSPLYAIAASNDIAAAMMRNNGEVLTQEVIDEAIDFRQTLAHLHGEYVRKGSWFFRPWNPPQVTDHATGAMYEFAEAPRDLLRFDQRCWQLEPSAAWHGFADLENSWAMLDPIKVSILAPGMREDGSFEECGVPADLVSSFLYKEGIVPTRTTDFQLMFLFSMGITKGKWSTLLNALIKFKLLYDSNAPLADVLPELVEQYPDHYRMLGLKELGSRMYCFIRREDPGKLLNAAFSTLPKMDMLPREAFMKIVANDVEMVSCDHLYDRTAAASIIPYPPGIPLLMSGENFGGAQSPQIAYIKSLLNWNLNFPGFEHITEGTQMQNNKCMVMCVKK